ncbi:hypothetical protein DID78_05950 [Candidatus Marinamargulisbacteria bacterium SCGC AG-343-D04]|nr:hypothetical protein DID78_05950 [Candidatus Marinamargulisbacteria bacterium SCGC AG-343-D04]
MYKKRIAMLCALLLVIFIQSKNIQATSGTISIGPVSGLAHSGVGGYHDVDTMVLNPSWLVDFSGKHVTKFGMVSFVPSFKSKQNVEAININTGYIENKMETVQLPHFALITKLSDNVAYGLGVFSGGGSGSDFTEAPDSYQILFNESKNHFGTIGLANSISIKKDNFRTGLTLDIVSGMLSTSKNDPVNKVGSSDTPIKLTTDSSATAMRYQLGAGYVLNPMIQFGISYTSKLQLDFERGLIDYKDNQFIYSNKKLDEPSRISVGANIKKNRYKVITDIHFINWEDTHYKDYGWQNSTMVNVGLQYSVIPDKLISSIGYSLSSRVIKHSSNIEFETAFLNTAIIPAILEKEIFLSTDYFIKEHLKLSGTFIYWPETSVTQKGSYFGSDFSGTLSSQGYAMMLGLNVMM